LSLSAFRAISSEIKKQQHQQPEMSNNSRKMFNPLRAFNSQPATTRPTSYRITIIIISIKIFLSSFALVNLQIYLPNVAGFAVY